MNKKQYQFLNENRVPKNSIKLFYSRLFEKYNTLKINGQTIGYKIKVQALKYTSFEWNQGSKVATSIKQPEMLFSNRRLSFYFIVQGEK